MPVSQPTPTPTSDYCTCLIREPLEQLAKDSPTRYNFREAVEPLSENALPLSPQKMLEFYQILEDEAYSIAKGYSGDAPIPEDTLHWARDVIKKNNIEYLQKINSKPAAIDTKQLFEDADKLTEVISKSTDVKILIENYKDLNTEEKMFYIQNIFDTLVVTLDLPQVQLETFEEALTDAGFALGTTPHPKLINGDYIIRLNIHPDALDDPTRDINTLIHELYHIKQHILGDIPDATVDELLALSLPWNLHPNDFGYDTYYNSWHEQYARIIADRVQDNLLAMLSLDEASMDPCFNGEEEFNMETCKEFARFNFNKEWFDSIENDMPSDAASDVLNVDSEVTFVVEDTFREIADVLLDNASYAIDAIGTAHPTFRMFSILAKSPIGVVCKSKLWTMWAKSTLGQRTMQLSEMINCSKELLSPKSKQPTEVVSENYTLSDGWLYSNSP